MSVFFAFTIYRDVVGPTSIADITIKNAAGHVRVEVVTLTKRFRYRPIGADFKQKYGTGKRLAKYVRLNFIETVYTCVHVCFIIIS